jgi:hypothetical protein
VAEAAFHQNFSTKKSNVYGTCSMQEKKMGHFGTLWDICRLNLQTPQALNGKSNLKQAYFKMHLRVFFFFCTLS